ncbi:hypothetical protein LY90DRAFT_513513 [Neocallimastix californiae]|uniref:Uncharacterized protein n=1 Tax=Neocallimastix californiae TaxID=1754190 RepID=A0A1Y2AX20_9FUNG|nr:hypothetical protein LY90DRAFT_513513 [Neocallimastix californiae]|eukprot:ORY27129.1 hypothetical protein LY90DRAFT_513513 [Neocallimastix californiae]
MFKVLEFDYYFIQIGLIEYHVQYAECDDSNGTCRIALYGSGNGVHDKLILSLHFNDNEIINIKEKSYEEILQQLKNNPKNKLKSAHYCNPINNLYITNINYSEKMKESPEFHGI